MKTHSPHTTPSKTLPASPAAHTPFFTKSTAPQIQKLTALQESSPQNVTEVGAIPWRNRDGSPGPASGNNYQVYTNQGNPVEVFVGYSGTPREFMSWCHGFSLGTYEQYGYSVYSGQPMGQVIQDEFHRVNETDAQPGDLLVWMTCLGTPGGFCHSAIIAAPGVNGSILSPDQTFVDSKNGGQAVRRHITLRELADVYGADYVVYRRN